MHFEKIVQKIKNLKQTNITYSIFLILICYIISTQLLNFKLYVHIITYK